MQQVALEDAKRELADLIDAAISGKDVFISKIEGVTVQLVPLMTSRRKRQFGSVKGLISMATDFDEPLGRLERVYVMDYLLDTHINLV